MAEEKYIPTLEDKLIYTGLIAQNTVGQIQQAYAAGKMDMETYTALYKQSSTVARLIRAMHDDQYKDLPLETFMEIVGSRKSDGEGNDEQGPTPPHTAL
jgi:hypothetical protein